MLWTYPPLYNMVKKQNVAQQRLGLQNYLPKPLCVLVEGTAPCRNSCLELSRMSWSPATMETPSLHSLVIGSEGVEVTVMEKETSCALWYSTLCRHIAFVFTFLLQSLAWSSPLV